MSKSSIPWCDATWNPVRGCSRVSPGCVNCYAERMAARNLPAMRSPTTGEPFAIMKPSGPHWTGKVELIESKLEEPLHWRKPRRVFVNSMSDLFHESLPFESVALVYAAIYSAGRAGPAEHTYQILTKRPARRLAFFAWLAKEAHRCHWPIPDFLSTQFGAGPSALRHDGRAYPAPYYSAWPHPHIWEGVSAEDQPTADERIPLLLQTPAAVRFVSYEPALAAVDFEPYFDGPEDRLSVEGHRDHVGRRLGLALRPASRARIVRSAASGAGRWQRMAADCLDRQRWQAPQVAGAQVPLAARASHPVAQALERACVSSHQTTRARWPRNARGTAEARLAARAIRTAAHAVR